MEYRNLGQTDLKVSRVGFGCWAIGGYRWGKINDRDSIAAIRKSLDLGINFFDTADVYGLGHSEEILAKGLGKSRKKVMIATKFGLKWDKRGEITRDASPKRVLEALDESLRRLKLDCIPLYQIHWPDPKTPLAETLEALEKCKRAGKIRHIGCSNFSADLIEAAQKFLRVESLQTSYNLVDRGIEKKLISCCRKWKMGVITYGPLVQGLFTGKYGKDSKFDKKDVRGRYENWKGKKFEANLKLVEELRKMGQKYGKTPAQVAIRWILENPIVDCVLTGITKPEHIIENSGAMGWKLLPKDRELLTKYAEDVSRV